jgi:hypothetical protein
LGGAMSVGIPPFLTLSEKPSALRDKSGTLQNPDRFASSKIPHWNSISIKPPFLDENSYDYCSRSSRIDFCGFWIQRIPTFPPDAAAPARRWPVNICTLFSPAVTFM